MLVGEICSKTGLSRDTVRFYEKKGLIDVGRVERRDNGYKEYSEDILQRLNSIKLMKGFGFTLNEISDLLDLMDVNEATCDNVANLAQGKIALLDQKIQELKQIQAILQKGLNKCQGEPCDPEFPDANCPAIVKGEM